MDRQGSLTGRNGYAVALVALAVGGIGLIVGYGMTWAVTTVDLLPGATREQGLSGRDLYPAAAAAGWLALAAVAGIVATRSWGRVIVAVVGLVAGAAGAAGAVAGALAADRSGIGWLVAAAAAALVIAACAATVARGRTWPSMGGRYERGARRDREMSAWEAQDLGRDPTDDLVE